MNQNLPQRLAAILEDCWQLDTRKRPSANQLVARLRDWASQEDFARYAPNADGVMSTKEREEARKAASKGQVSLGESGSGQKSEDWNPVEASSTITAPEWLEERPPCNDKASRHFCDF